MENRIFHIDMDSFFPSVETLFNPKYEKVPMVVGSKVVASANYLARKYAIKSGMQLTEAKKRFPKLIIVKPDKDKYLKISLEIETFLHKLIKNIETGSIDEWYIDISDSKFANWNENEFASLIKHEIKNKFKLNCTIGNSFTMFLAKMATNLCKPDGFLTLNKQNFQIFIKDLPVSKIVGIGPSTTKILKEMNLNFIKDIIELEDDYLARKKIGITWSKIKMNVAGINCDVINPHHKRKNLGRSQSIKGYTEYMEFYNLINELCDDINKNLKNGDFLYDSINLKLKLSNNNSLTKTYRFDLHTNSIPFNQVLTLFEQLISPSNYQNIINLSITANNLKENDHTFQLDIFNSLSEKKQSEDNKLEMIKKTINKKFNKKVIDFASYKQNQ